MGYSKKRDLTQEQVKHLFDYHEDGYLIWKNSVKNSKIKSGARAGTVAPTSYYQVKINGKIYLVHVIIFLWHNGYIPEHDVDHKDTNKLNNKISNLEEKTKSCNVINKGLGKNNISGVKGVKKIKNKYKQTYRGFINVNKKYIDLGGFDNMLDAALARYNAEIEYGYINALAESTAYLYLKAHNAI